MATYEARMAAQGQGDIGHAFKRRGLIAGAAALVAGALAKQTAQSVAAAYNFQGDTTNTASASTILNGAIGGQLFALTNTNGVSSGAHALEAQAVAGIAVQGASSLNIGLDGSSNSTIGVRGQITSISSTNNTIGVFGNNQSTGAGGIGVRGDATNGIGVFGSTSAAGQFGVLGQTLVDNSFGITGIANTNGSAAFAGATSNASSFAASFQGHVQVFGGAFDVFPMGNKHGLAQHPDGSVRTFYSVESPECWVEDFGEGTLTAGKADIKLDADFAALIHTDKYHVFLTEHGGHHGLHTTSKVAGGFVVEADADLAVAKGKSAAQSSGTFSWRVVAKPKTDANVERLAKGRLAPKIDLTKLPKQPPTPPKTP